MASYADVQMSKLNNLLKQHAPRSKRFKTMAPAEEAKCNNA